MNWYFLGSNIQHTKTVPTKIPLNSWCLFPVNKSVWNYLQCLHMSIKKHTLQPKKQEKSSPPLPPLLSFHPLKNPLFLRWSTPSKKKQGLFKSNIPPKSKQTFGPDRTWQIRVIIPQQRGPRSRLMDCGSARTLLDPQVLFQQRVVELPSRLIGTILTHRIHVWYIYHILLLKTTKCR